LVLEIVGQNCLGHLFRDPDVEPVAGRVSSEVQLAQRRAARAESGTPHPHPVLEKAVDDADGFEDLERPWMDHRRPVPSTRRVGFIDEQALDTSPLQLCRQQEAGRPCSDHHDPRTGRAVVRLCRHILTVCRGSFAPIQECNGRLRAHRSPFASPGNASKTKPRSQPVTRQGARAPAIRGSSASLVCRPLCTRRSSS
jgi:hypothetical protein